MLLSSDGRSGGRVRRGRGRGTRQRGGASHVTGASHVAGPPQARAPQEPGPLQEPELPPTPSVPRIVLSDSASERAGATDEVVRFEALARDCLEECRRELMMSFRFLSVALWHMPMQAESGLPPLATDGRTIYYDPVGVVLLYRHKHNMLVRTYLHLILHCIFRHPFQRGQLEPRALSIASDLIVEATALDMCESRYECEGDDRRREIIDALALRLGDFRPRTVARAIGRSYDEYRGAGPVGARDLAAGDEWAQNAFAATGAGLALLSPEELSEIDQLFEFDSHRKWECYRNDDETGDGPDRNVSGAPENAEEGPAGSGDTPKPTEGQEGKNGDDEGDGEGSDSGGAGGDAPDDSGDAGGQDDGAAQPGSAGAQGGAGGGSQDADADGSDGEAGSDGDAGSDDAGADGSDAGDSDSDPADPDAGDSADADTPPEQAPGSAGAQADEAQKEWDEISRQVEMELRSHKAQWGERAGELSAVLQIQNRKRYDYADFLRRFSTMQEDMRLSDDEFDYIYYVYGLKRYGNMPLIEPLEYTECKRIREFAIVIDTSESCSGELVTRFIQRTYDILKESESFFSEVNIHIVQCDARVQRDTKIESLDELERYLSEFEIFGLGGTDFRPAFAYVDELVATGEFENLQGLVYFTDGRGTYPDTQPDYDTAFVFLSDGAERVRIPPWAMKVVMDEDEIRDL